jgi:hypothetical protein
MNLTLVENWQAIIAKAWSVKFNIAATLFGAAEVAVALVQPAAIPNGVFAGIAAFISILSNVSRVMAQKELSSGPVK